MLYLADSSRIITVGTKY